MITLQLPLAYELNINY